MSRRRRNYVLRFTYLGLLLIFLVLVWLEEVRYGQSAVYAVSRMGRAGQSIVAFIVWFQFCATQLVAVTMLSTAISDKIYRRTLGSLSPYEHQPVLPSPVGDDFSRQRLGQSQALLLVRIQHRAR